MLRFTSFRAFFVFAIICTLLGASLSHAASFTWDGLGVDNNWKTGANWIGGASPPPGSVLVFDGSTRPLTTDNYAAATPFAGIVFNSTASAAFSLSGPNSINLTGNITDNEQAFNDTLALPIALQITPTISITSFGSLTDTGVISGNFGLNQTGAGTLVFTSTAVNTFTGPVTVGNGSTLAIVQDTNLGVVPSATTANDLVLNGGATLFDNNPLTTSTGAGATVVNLTISPKRGITILNNGGATPSSATINVPGLIANTQGGVNVRQTITYDGVIADNGTVAGLNKLGFGILVLGGANTYTGATTIGNGTLNLDFTQLTGGSAVSSNIINSTSALTLGGSTAGLGDTSYAQLIITGAANVTNSQAFVSTNITTGIANIRVNSGTSGTANLNLGTLTHNAGGVVNFILPASGAISVNSGTTTNTNGILGGWATIGTGVVQNQVFQATDWATLNGSGQVVAYTGYTTYGTGGTIAAGTQLQGNVTASTNLQKIDTSAEAIAVSSGSGVTVNVNTIAFKNSAAGDTIVVGNNNTLNFGKYGGILKQDGTTDPASLFIGGATGSGTQASNGTAGSQGIGTITAGGPTAGPGEIVFTLSSSSETTGTLIVEPTITDNPLGGAVTVVKAGAGSMKLDGHNTFSGGLYIESGRLQFAGSEVNSTSPNPDGGGTGPIFVFPGAQLFPSGAGSAASPQTITNPIFLAGIGINADGTGSIRMGQGVTIGTPTSKITLIGNDRIGGGGAAFVDPTTAALHPGSLLAGQITGNFNMDFGASGNTGGSGTLLWINNQNNNWTGNTTILGRVGSAGNTILHTAANNVIPNGVINVGGVPFVTGNLIMGVVGDVTSGETLTLDLDGTNQTINGLMTGLTATGATAVSQFIENDGYYYTPGQNGNTQPTPAGMPTAATQSILTLGNNNQTAAFSGIIRDTVSPANITGTVGGNSYTYVATGDTMALTKIGSGVQTLSGVNTYSGNTNINAGALAITGSLLNTGTVNVNTSATSAGALYGGSGTTVGTVGNVILAASNNGNQAVINPGATGPGSTGILSLASLTANAGSNLQFDLNGTAAAGTNYDQIQVAGSAAFSGTTFITPTSTTQGTYTVLTASSISGPVPTLASAGDTRLTFAYDPTSYTGSSGNSIVVDVTGSTANLTWSGAVPSRASDGTTWDLHITPNWLSSPTPSVGDPNEFYNLDNVTFDNTGITNGNSNIFVSGSVKPGSMIFSNTSGNYVIGGTGTIDGSGSMVINGVGGTVTLATVNTFSGGVTLNAGSTLNINANALGSGTFTINGGVLGNTGAQAVTISTNPLQVWNSDITFNGPSDLNLGTGAVTSTTVGGTRTFNITAGTLTVGGAITETNAGTGIAKNGAGTLVLGANSTFTGAVTINAGTINAGSVNALGTVGTIPSITVGTAALASASNAALDVGANPTANTTNFGATPITIYGTGVNNNGALTNSGTLAQQNAYQNVTLGSNATVGGTGRFDIRTTALGALLNLNGNTLTKTGTNQFSIVNATVNAGNIVVNQGTLSIEANTTIANNNDGTSITYNAGTIAGFYENAVDPSNPGNSLVQRPMVFVGGVTINDESAANFTTSIVGSNMTLEGNITFSSNAVSTITFTGSMTESGGSYSVTKSGANTVVLTSTNNAFSGPVNLNAGLLNFAALGTLGTGTQLNFAGGGLQYAAGMASPPDLSVRTITFNAGGGTIDTNGNNVTFAHSIGNGGVGGFTKAGGGTLILNANSTYTGSTTVANGTLMLGSAGAFPASTPLAFGDTANDTGTLDVAGKSITVTGLTTVGTTAAVNGSTGNIMNSTSTPVTITFAAANNTPNVFNGNIQDGSGAATSLTINSGTLVLMSSSSYSGATLIKPGATLQLGNGSVVNSAGLGNTAITDNGSLVFSSQTLNLNNGNTISGSGTVTQTGTGTQTFLNSSNSYTGATILQGGFLAISSDAAINNAAGGIQFNGGTLQYNNYNSTLSLTNSNTSGGNVNLGSTGTSSTSGNINFTGNFTYAGPGQLTLTGTTLAYTGSTTIQNGTLVLGGATLPTNTSLAMGDAANDSPTLDLNGRNITVSTLTIAGTGSPAITNNGVTNSTVIYAGGAANSTFGGRIQNGNTNSVALQVNSGSLTLSSNSSYTGSTTIGNGAKLTLSTGGAINNTSKLILQGGTLALAGNSQQMTSAALSMTGNSIIDLGAANTGMQLVIGDSHTQAWSGVLRISDWTGNAGPGGGNGTDQVQINNDSTLTGLTSTQLGEIHFTGYLTGATLVANGSNSEVVPASATQLLRGDVSRDQHVDMSDVSTLLSLLANPDGYAASHPGFDSFDLQDVADVNNDGKINNADIQALLTLLIGNGGSQSTVPEPSSIVLLGLLGLACFPFARRHLKVAKSDMAG